jgi:hypothetical protein
MAIVLDSLRERGKGCEKSRGLRDFLGPSATATVAWREPVSTRHVVRRAFANGTPAGVNLGHCEKGMYDTLGTGRIGQLRDAQKVGESSGAGFEGITARLPLTNQRPHGRSRRCAERESQVSSHRDPSWRPLAAPDPRLKARAVAVIIRAAGALPRAACSRRVGVATRAGRMLRCERGTAFL